MNTRETYIISTKTAALYRHYELANEYTLAVLLSGETFIVKQTMEQILRASVHYYGNNLEKTIQTARKILNKQGIVPLPLSLKQNLILILCKAPNHNGSIWINYLSIRDIHRYRIHQSKVVLSNGLTFHVNNKVNTLQDLRNGAVDLYLSQVNQPHMEKTKYYFYYRENNTIVALETRRLQNHVKKDKEDDEDLDLVLK